MNKIRKNDEVVLIAGKNKGARGKVLNVLPNDKLILEGINLVKKHKKPNPQKNERGGIIEKPMPVHVSNVMHYDASVGKPGRIGFKILEDGRKVRYFKLSQEILDNNP